MLDLGKFLADLDAVRPKKRFGSFPIRFVDDLDAAYVAARKSSFYQPIATLDDLKNLSEVFQSWRQHHGQLLRHYLARLPSDDPMLLPVSLFGTMDYGRLETAHTRTLAWLLGDQEHGFGSQLLDAFLRHVLNDAQIRVTHLGRAIAEYPCLSTTHSAAGRLDVLIEGRWQAGQQEVSWLMAIEAKIDADEGEEQLSMYDDWLERHAGAREVVRVFLTPDGRVPETGEAQWKPMSFVDLAGVFRRTPGLQDMPGYHFLRYYLAGLLRDVCELPVPISADCQNPYVAVDYLKSVLGSATVETTNGESR